jgi:hypothetical protein
VSPIIRMQALAKLLRNCSPVWAVSSHHNVGDVTRQCTGCGVVKDPDQFYPGSRKQKSGKIQSRARCKECEKQASRRAA